MIQPTINRYHWALSYGTYGTYSRYAVKILPGAGVSYRIQAQKVEQREAWPQIYFMGWAAFMQPAEVGRRGSPMDIACGTAPAVPRPSGQNPIRRSGNMSWVRAVMSW